MTGLSQCSWTKTMNHKIIAIWAGLAGLLQACSPGQDQASTAPSGSDNSTTLMTSRTPAPTTAKAFFVSPAKGKTVSSPILVQFGLEGLEVAPAGTYEPGTGHHHLLVDIQPPKMDMAVPADANHIHFGKGQTETTVELSPGPHTLQLLVGDGNHVPHQPPIMSEAISITVE